MLIAPAPCGTNQIANVDISLSKPFLPLNFCGVC